MKDSQIKKSTLIIKITVAAAFIPFILFTLNQLMLQTFNLTYPDLRIRLKYALQPTIYILYLSAATIIVIIIIRQLSGLFTYFEKNEDYNKARISTLKIPWILILVNSGLWVATITLFYAIQGFKSEGGVPYFWSLTTNSLSGCVSAILAALIINRILIPAKIKLNMTDIRDGESDLFVRIKIPLAFVTGFIYTVLVLIYGARFYMITSTESLPQLPIGFGTAMLISALLGFLPISLNLILAISEDRLQRNLLLNKMRVLTSGNGDLGQKVNLINFDETGALAEIINTFIEKIRTLIIKADRTGNQIVETSSDIGNLLSKLAETTGTMLDAINSVDNEMGVQEEEISRVRTSLDSYFSALEDLNNNITSQSGSVEQTSQAANSIASSIMSEGQMVIEIEQQTLKLSEITKNGSGHIEDFIESISAVEQSSQAVEEILEQMNVLSKQIDMLAMNAAIEAAHAGDAGKGFAVVAEEVRRLSENSAEQSGQIANEMSLMMSSITEGTSRTKQAETAFHDISNNVETTAVYFNKIVESSNNEETAVKELITTVNHLVKITNALKEIAKNQRNHNDNMKNLMEKVFSRFGGLKQSMNAQRENRNFVSENLNQLNEITTKNLTVVQELNEILKQFSL